ncbi:DUF4913 domain-containing protein [Streptomyces glebosus]|uniref:DUF4913 domain-containing protein n=1 Tax=Streptomyces glebosus TaxID=249580 RepID=A0A640T2L5_9ACTN|nr:MULTISPECIES: DUF4913 domain-containing protein [Streptomyces]KOG50573.1 hypothetical protein ADK74_00555 [Streptomyces decoyicus]QZY15159.1 DUF4913 domain-containing protein [Streptomyces decoyicus]GFE17939.1 DUF4913 domain-containing protein [Streptomyces glebosus]GHG46979.1 DUF4913 domain-containing protein [Streptomyces glebosus]
MSGPGHDGDESVRIPDHDLDDLVCTVTRLVAASRKQSETLARLTDDQPAVELQEPGEPTAEPGAVPVSSRSADTQDLGASQDDGPSSVFILALDGKAYAEELAALTRWVHDLLLPVYGREITTGRPWCRQWQEHPEAVARLHALWLAWQQLTDIEAGLTGPSTWHRDHLDPTWMQLRMPDGPFGACTTSPGRPNHRLLASPEPAGA